MWLQKVASYTEKCSLEDHLLASKPQEDRLAQTQLTGKDKTVIVKALKA
jgi:hypothetical protein